MICLYYSKNLIEMFGHLIMVVTKSNPFYCRFIDYRLFFLHLYMFFNWGMLVRLLGLFNPYPTDYRAPKC